MSRRRRTHQRRAVHARPGLLVRRGAGNDGGAPQRYEESKCACVHEVPLCVWAEAVRGGGAGVSEWAGGGGLEG
jgi:hypothetical protein